MLRKKILQRKHKESEMMHRKMTQKRAGCHSAQAPLDIWQMERVLSRVSCLSCLAGLSAASLSLALWYWGLRLIFGNVGIMVDMSDGQTMALLGVSVIVFCLRLLMKIAGRKARQDSFEAYPNAAAYYGQCARSYPVKTALCSAAWASGYILSVCLPGYFRYSDLRLALAVCAAMSAFGAFFLVSRLQERHICAGDEGQVRAGFQ